MIRRPSQRLAPPVLPALLVLLDPPAQRAHRGHLELPALLVLLDLPDLRVQASASACL